MFVSGGFGAQLINFATLYLIFELHFLINKTSIFYNYSINVRFILYYSNKQCWNLKTINDIITVISNYKLEVYERILRLNQLENGSSTGK